MGKAVSAFFFCILMFAPVIIGLVFILHRVFGPYMAQYSLFQLAALQMFNIINGDIDINSLLETDAFMALLFTLVLYFFLTFGLMNIFLITVVDAYYVVHLTREGASSIESWSWSRLKKWALPSLFI